MSRREQYIEYYTDRCHRAEYVIKKNKQDVILKEQSDKEREIKLIKGKEDAIIVRENNMNEIRTTLEQLYKNNDRDGLKKFVKDPYQIFCSYILPTNNKPYTKWFIVSSVAFMKDIIRGGVLFCNYDVFYKIYELNINVSIFKCMAGNNQTICDIIDGKVQKAKQEEKNKTEAMIKSLKTLYKEKNKEKVNEVIQDPYDIFIRYILPTNNKAYTKWFLTSSTEFLDDIMKMVIKYSKKDIINKMKEMKINLKKYEDNINKMRM